MKILVLAPHPFYIVRGTPIDVDLVLRVLSARADTEVDVVVYSGGSDRSYPNITIHRSRDLPLARQPGPGFSTKKLICDFCLFTKALSLLRTQHYDLIHAGEEAVYMAMCFRRLFGVQYAYDLDSSLAEQMIEKMPRLRVFGRFFDACERAAIREALMTFPVCHSLADRCHDFGAREVVTLHDISQLDTPGRAATGRLKRELGIRGSLLLYAGNLEAYQGIDLLLDGFALATRRTTDVDLVIVGGSDADIRVYQARAEALRIGDRVHFLGPKPFDELDYYLAEADILTAPRIKGRNTPMKVFPYLHSGRPVLVTDLPTHSQILTDDVAVLATPTPQGFADAIVELTESSERRRMLGERGQAFVEANHTFEAHAARLNEAYDRLEQMLRHGGSRTSHVTREATA